MTARIATANLPQPVQVRRRKKRLCRTLIRQKKYRCNQRGSDGIGRTEPKTNTMKNTILFASFSDVRERSRRRHERNEQSEWSRQAHKAGWNMDLTNLYFNQA